MQSTNSAKNLDLEPVVLAEEEVPDPSPPTTILTMPTRTPTATTMPSTPTPTQTAPPSQSLLPVFQALAMVLAGRLMALLLLLSDILLGFLVINDPTPMRLIAGAGYAIFSLATLWILPKK